MAPDPRSERAGVRGVSRPALEGLLLIRMLGGRLAPRRLSFFSYCTSAPKSQLQLNYCTLNNKTRLDQDGAYLIIQILVLVFHGLFLKSNCWKLFCKFLHINAKLCNLSLDFAIRLQGGNKVLQLRSTYFARVKNKNIYQIIPLETQTPQ